MNATELFTEANAKVAKGGDITLPLQGELGFRSPRMVEAPSEAEVELFRGYLLEQAEWRTRAQVGEALGWSERKVRHAAEALGAAVVRGQRGFKLLEKLSRTDLPTAVAASDSFISQGKHMIKLGLSLKRRIHEVVG